MVAQLYASDGMWRHKSIVLSPLNPDFEPIRLDEEDEDRIGVVAELIEVIG
ncbi:MAG TPA: hypothetical protein VMM76_19470 [Pirellulaceae bacterium]|nr:hypothetical protein [Pirellulaceae bacterium]